MGFQSLQQSLTERTQPEPRTSWVPIAGLVISLVIVLGGIIGFTFSSMQREIDLRFSHYRSTILELEDDIKVQHRSQDILHREEALKLQNIETGMRALGAYVKEHAAKHQH